MAKAEDVEATDKVVEEIEVNLPIIDHYISLLRTEIDDLKAGKLDHCLREVVATPLIDPKLHLALSKAIDGGLLLPPPPNLSDSESEGEREGHEEGEDGEEEEEEDRETGKIAEGKEEEDEAAYTDGKGAAAGGGMPSGEEQKGDNDDEKLVGEINGGISRQPYDKCGSDGASYPRDGSRESDRGDATELTATTTSKTSEIENDRTPPHTERTREINGLTLSATKPLVGDNQGSSVTQNGTSARSDGSPLRDRPPILSGGGSRVAPAAPPPQPTSQPSSECAKGVLTGDSDGKNGGVGVDGRKDGGREKDEGFLESVRRHVAGGAAAIVIPEMKSAKKKPGGDDLGGEIGGKEGDSQESSKLGRKRGRASDSESCATSHRHRMSRPRRRDGEESADDEGNVGGAKKHATDETETVKKERGDSFDEEQFRRIALEVWDRVYKHKFAIIFRKPVNPKDAPGYEKVIKKPMDLALMKRRIMSGALMSLDDLSRDLFVMCNNAMVFNGKGDPYFDYSKELRTYASEVISEARRPGFVTADPGFDSIVAGTRFSRARQPSPCPSVTPRSAPRGRGRQKRKNGAGNGGGRRSPRDSDSTSVADDTGDEGGKVRRGRGRAGDCANGKKRGRKRGIANSKSKGKNVGSRRGARSQDSSEAESVGDSSLWVSSSEEDCDNEWESVSRSKSPSERGTGKKRTAGGKVMRRAKEDSGDSSYEDRSPRGKVRKGEKPVAKRKSSSKMSAGKKKGY